ncbi:MAG: SDR family NAD(P)-dependent oxidoreductase, partial [Bythopirellula sp.]
MKTIDLTGKTAVVTGASQGLGRAIAEQLHAAGANVVVNYACFENDNGQNQRQAEAVVDQLGERALAIAADVRDASAVAKMFDQAEQHWHQIDIVVNNAGITRDRALKNMAHEDWQTVVDTNLNGVFHVCQAAAKRLADEGRIVNISSLSAFIGVFGQANYAASKAGVAALSKVLSRELAKRKITVNTISPGLVLTEMGKATPD